MEKIIKRYLKQYKKDLLPAALFLAGIILFWQIVIPQIDSVVEIRENIESQVTTNEDLRQSQTTLNSISDSELDDNYEIAVQALPTNKSIGSIFQALTAAASRSNVSIGSLNIQVGSVYDVDSEKTVGRTIEGVPFLNLIVSVNGNSALDMTNFANVLYETSPVLEINEISSTDSEGKFDIDFFFKPISENGFKNQTVIAPLTPSQQELLTTLKSWSL